MTRIETPKYLIGIDWQILSLNINEQLTIVQLTTTKKEV